MPTFGLSKRSKTALMRRLSQKQDTLDAAELSALIAGGKSPGCQLCACDRLRCSHLDFAVLSTVFCSRDALAMVVDSIEEEDALIGHGIAALIAVAHSANRPFLDGAIPPTHDDSGRFLLQHALTRALSDVIECYWSAECYWAAAVHAELAPASAGNHAHHLAIERTLVPWRAVAHSARLLVAAGDHGPDADAWMRIATLDPPDVYPGLGSLIGQSANAEEHASMFADFIRDTTAAGDHARDGEQLALAVEQHSSTAASSPHGIILDYLSHAAAAQWEDARETLESYLSEDD